MQRLIKGVGQLVGCPLLDGLQDADAKGAARRQVHLRSTLWCCVHELSTMLRTLYKPDFLSVRICTTLPASPT